MARRSIQFPALPTDEGTTMDRIVAMAGGVLRLWELAEAAKAGPKAIMTGPRGGRYYLDSKGRKVYADESQQGGGEATEPEVFKYEPGLGLGDLSAKPLEELESLRKRWQYALDDLSHHAADRLSPDAADHRKRIEVLTREIESRKKRNEGEPGSGQPPAYQAVSTTAMAAAESEAKQGQKDLKRAADAQTPHEQRQTSRVAIKQFARAVDEHADATEVLRDAGKEVHEQMTRGEITPEKGIRELRRIVGLLEKHGSQATALGTVVQRISDRFRAEPTETRTFMEHLAFGASLYLRAVRTDTEVTKARLANVESAAAKPAEPPALAPTGGGKKRVTDWMHVISRDSTGAYIVTRGDPAKAGSQILARFSDPETQKYEIENWVRGNIGKRISHNHAIDITGQKLVPDTWDATFDAGAKPAAPAAARATSDTISRIQQIRTSPKSGAQPQAGTSQATAISALQAERDAAVSQTSTLRRFADEAVKEARQDPTPHRQVSAAGEVLGESEAHMRAAETEFKIASTLEVEAKGAPTDASRQAVAAAQQAAKHHAETALVRAAYATGLLMDSRSGGGNVMAADGHMERAKEIGGRATRLAHAVENWAQIGPGHEAGASQEAASGPAPTSAYRPKRGDGEGWTATNKGTVETGPRRHQTNDVLGAVRHAATRAQESGADQFVVMSTKGWVLAKPGEVGLATHYHVTPQGVATLWKRSLGETSKGDLDALVTPGTYTDLVAILNEALAAEHAAIIQYGTHAALLENWGYHAAAKEIEHRAETEQEHAKELTDRILFLGGFPVAVPDPSDIIRAADVTGILAADATQEQRARDLYNHAIAKAVEAGDNGTRDILAHILAEEEAHINYISAETAKVDQMGLPAYLSTMGRTGFGMPRSAYKGGVSDEVAEALAALDAQDE